MPSKRTKSGSSGPCEETRSPSKPKKQKASKPEPERRVDAFGKVVRYSPKPSQKVLERIERALPGSGHRMFLLARDILTLNASTSGSIVKYAVLGATANVYNVELGRCPSCSCPDFAKGNLCKHILFVYLRVLKLSPANPVIWQKALIQSEVDAILERDAEGSDALASEQVQLNYRRLSQGETMDKGANGRRPVEGDCPICFEEMTGEKEPITWCQACGNNMHEVCFKRWAQSKRSLSQPVTCVYCRANWIGEGGNAGPGCERGGYINLAHVSDAHNAENTSLESLYGDRAVWINARQGYIGRASAARLYRAGQ